MPVYKMYRKNNLQPIREYVEGEDLSDVSVWDGDSPEKGGMIAINPEDLTDKWYVNKDFFDNNYVLDNDDLYVEGLIVIGEMGGDDVIDLGTYVLKKAHNG